MTPNSTIKPSAATTRAPGASGAPGAPQAARRKRPPRRGAMIGPSFMSAVEALWANRMRSLLTTLGVIVGVSAVIAVVTLTQGTSALINSRIATLGTNTIIITPGAAASGGAFGASGTQQSLTQQDADALASIGHVVGVSPVLGINAQLIAGAQNWNTRVQGVYPDFQTIQTWQMSEGQWFTAADETEGLPVVVIGQTVVDNLFTPSGTDPLGQTILIKSQAFRVVGVLQAKGASGFSNQDDVAYVPFSTADSRLNNTTYVSQVQVQADGPDSVAPVQQAITTILEQRHHISGGAPDDFSVRSPTQIVQTAQQFAQTLALLLIGVAAISLIVGGIGIMNIMLVSVTERTREIGVRMAVGARRSDVRNQFLIEAFTLSSAGGLVGILLGLLFGLGFTLAFHLPFVLNFVWILVSFGVSALVGVVFGLYPAVRASQLDPIVALRSE